ncbi:MAG TPA: DNA repair protein RecO [Steroidobacteraceae bacterium]|nr:DNA repair protein RecO [Steroidobacteraceae bacterium]
MKTAGRPSARRVWLAPAYVLHQYAYRDTSRIVEVFTSDHGRLTLFARGANGAKSTLKGVLRPFQRMLVSWSGKGEACQLVTAEIDGLMTTLAPNRLMSGFYLNELLLKLTERCDPHPEIFFSYASCVQSLCAGDVEEPTLRRFEKRLLNDLGYGLELARTADGVPVAPDGYYRFALQSGPQLCVAEAPGAVYGQSLADLQLESFGDPRSLRDAKRVLRAAIDTCLDGRILKSREVALALRHREPKERPREHSRRDDSVSPEGS